MRKSNLATDVSIPARGARCIEVAMKFTTMDLQFQSPQGVRDASQVNEEAMVTNTFQSPQGVRDASNFDPRKNKVFVRSFQSPQGVRDASV